MRIERIESLDDPRVADYRDVKDGDLAGRGGRFMAEGELVVRRLIEGSRFRPVSVFVAENRLERLHDALERLPKGAPVYVAPVALFEAIVGFHLHRGVLAVGERGAPLRAEEAIGSLGAGAATVVIVEDLANHDNMGGIFRNAAALGAGLILLTERCCDPLYRKSIRVSMGAALRLPFAGVGSLPKGYESLRRAGFAILAMTPAGDARDLCGVASAMSWPRRIGLALGAEGPGLSAGAMEAADARVKIAMAPGVDSLNVATACAVGLYALREASGDFREG